MQAPRTRGAADAAMAGPPRPRPRAGPGPGPEPYQAAEERHASARAHNTSNHYPLPLPHTQAPRTREAAGAAMAGPPRPGQGPGPEQYQYQAPEERPVYVRPPSSYSSALASCLVASVFLLLAVGGAAAALFLLFRPRPPDIAVAAVRFPAFAAANGTVAFTFEQTASVRNPNRAPLAHFDSSLRVAYAGGELGSVYIPAGLIDGGRTKDMSASFAVPAFAAATPPPPEIAASAAQQQPAAAPVMEVDSLLVVKGRVTVLRVLTHRVEAAKVCRVGVSPVDGKVLGFRC